MLLKIARILGVIVFSFIFLENNLAQKFTGDSIHIKSILDNINEFSAAYMAEDYTAIANAYTPDGKIFPGNSDIISGQEAIKQRWTLPSGFDVMHHEIMPIEITIIEDHAYDFGYYEGKTKAPDGKISTFRGKHVIVWKNTDNGWKIYLDIWNRI